MPDPIDADDPEELRATILRLRDQLVAADGRREVLEDRIAELERRERDLLVRIDALEHELSVTVGQKLVHRLRTLAGREP